MRIPRIYTRQALAGHSEYTLEEGPSQHLGRSLRMQPGDSLVLFDGRGDEYPASIVSLSKKAVTVRTAGPRAVDPESPLSIELGIAVSRGERMDWVMQKATELGVARIAPLYSERTEVRLKGERALKKLHHWQQIAISACEQCGRNRLPEITPLQNLGDWLAAVEAQRKLVLHHRSSGGGAGDARPGSVALLVGPEGGLSEAEIGSAEAAGFDSLALGPRVLRTETAPLAAIAILQARWGDMGSQLDS